MKVEARVYSYHDRYRQQERDCETVPQEKCLLSAKPETQMRCPELKTPATFFHLHRSTATSASLFYKQK